MDDPQLRAKLETLMLVYPDVTVARALHFLDEASTMITEAQASRFDRVTEREFSRIANLDDTEEMQP